MKRCLLLAAAIALAASGCKENPQPAQTSEISWFVATDGSNANPGTKEKPFATLEKARDAVRQANSAAAPRPVYVYLRKGTYYLEETFVLGPQDSGTPESPVIYTAYAGEDVTLSGARFVDGWQKLPDTPEGTAPEAAGKLWYADIPKGWFPHFLYIDDEPMTLARFPNEGFLEGDEGIQHFGDPGPEGQLIKFPELVRPFLPYLPDNGDVEMSWIPIIWANGVSVLRDFDVENNTAMRHSKNVLYKGSPEKNWMRANRFRLQNALPFIDTPGEWCVDTQKGRIYLWPKSDSMENKTFLAPKLYELIRLEGNDTKGERVHDIEIRDLHLTQTDRMPEDQWPDDWLKRNFENPDAALFIKDACRVTVANCKILHVGTFGVTLNKTAFDNRIVGNEIGYTGCGGVQLLGYGPGTKYENKKNLIQRNLIHHIGKNDYMHSAAVSLYQSGENIITHNYIYDGPYAGIVMVGAYYGDLNDMRRGNWTPERNLPYLHTDAYGNFEDQYQVRWDELPEGSYERFLNGTGTFTEFGFFKYLHCRDNYVAWNIVSDCMNGLADGGSLYCWCCDLGNEWVQNVVRDSGDKTIYLDDAIWGTELRENACWGKGGTISKGDNFWVDNSFGYPERPKNFNALFARIAGEVEEMGGWPGELDMEIPALQIEFQNGKLFHDAAEVTMTPLADDIAIRYTTDGTEPASDAPLYKSPVRLTETATVKARAFRGGSPLGETDTVTFSKIPEPPTPDFPITRYIFTNKVEYDFCQSGYQWIQNNMNDYTVHGRSWLQGFTMVEKDKVVCTLKPEYKRFVAMVAADDASDPRTQIRAEILIDDKPVYETPDIGLNTLPVMVDLDIPENSKTLTLRLKNFHHHWGFVDWIHAGFMSR